MKFSELKINKEIIKNLEEMGFSSMMPIQEKAIPIILDGKNIIGEAETGTGKTAAFVIPILNKIDFKSGKTECLIVTPTRELAIQIVNEIKKIGKNLNLSYATLVGGMSMRDQVRDLKRNPSIIVGTLGRVNDHLRSKKVDLSNIKYFVLDEADEMLKEGWKDDISSVNKKIPESKQTLLFSATISKKVLKLSEDIMDSYEFISVKNSDNQSANIEQYYIIMKEKSKFSVLTKLLDVDKPKSALIFGRTKRRADELNEALNKCGYKSECIHGDLSQGQRNTVMRKFREGKINILVATDVAARGIDVNDITHVYNFDLPQEIEFYIHRIGRTGRAKKLGISYSFIKEGELEHIKRIQKETKTVIKEKSIPNFDDVWEARNEEVIKKIDKMLSEIDVTNTKKFAKDLIDKYGSEALVSILIESFSKKKDINNITLTGEPPVKTRGNRSSSNRRNRNFKRSNDNRSNHYNRKNSRRS